MFLSESFYRTSAWWKSLNGVCTLIIFHYVRAQWNNVTCLHILILRGRKLPPLLYLISNGAESTFNSRWASQQLRFFMYLAIWLFKLKLPNHSSQHQGKGEYNSKKPHWTFCIPFSSFLSIVIKMIPSETLYIQSKQWKQNKCCSKSKCNPSFHVEIFMCKENVGSNIVEEK